MSIKSFKRKVIENKLATITIIEITAMVLFILLSILYSHITSKRCIEYFENKKNEIEKDSKNYSFFENFNQKNKNQIIFYKIRNSYGLNIKFMDKNNDYKEISNLMFDFDNMDVEVVKESRSKFFEHESQENYTYVHAYNIENSITGLNSTLKNMFPNLFLNRNISYSLRELISELKNCFKKIEYEQEVIISIFYDDNKVLLSIYTEKIPGSLALYDNIEIEITDKLGNKLLSNNFIIVLMHNIFISNK